MERGAFKELEEGLASQLSLLPRELKVATVAPKVNLPPGDFALGRGSPLATETSL